MVSLLKIINEIPAEKFTAKEFPSADGPLTGGGPMA
jgi:hypothetical protein